MVRSATQNPERPARVLVVEDNPGDMDLFRVAADEANLGAELEWAPTGERALDQLLATDDSALPALVVLDLNLPRMGGLELLRRMRDEPRLSNIPAAIFTSSRAQRNLIEGYHLGVTRFIQKGGADSDFTRAVAGLKDLLDPETRARWFDSEGKLIAARRLIRVLIVEDNEGDALLLEDEVWNAGFQPRVLRVDRAETYRRALEEQEWDVILCDHSMPGFSDLAALSILHLLGVDTPFIIVSGVRTEQEAVHLMLQGAEDYLTKTNLVRLGAVIARALHTVGERRERERLEQEIKEGHLREDVLGVVAHELRSPLGSLQLRLDLLQRELVRVEETSSPAQSRMAETLKRSVADIERASRFISDLLDVARIRSGQLRVHMVETDLGELVAESLNQLNATVAAAGCAQHVAITRGLVGMFDRVRIGQVVTNLVNNATRYAPGAPMEVTLQPGRDGVELRVRDGGPGIPANRWDVIFRRFERGEQKGTAGGLGLGLYICRRIVEAHRGTIRVERSEPGRGTTFLVTLPLLQAEATRGQNQPELH